MEVKVTIQCPELAAAISKLADALASKSTTPVQIPTAPIAPAVITTQVESTAPVQAAQDTPPWEAPAPVAPTPVIDAAYRSKVATAAARLIDQNKMPEVLKALEECGAQAVTQLDANSMPLFVQKITALGAVI